MGATHIQSISIPGVLNRPALSILLQKEHPWGEPALASNVPCLQRQHFSGKRLDLLGANPWSHPHYCQASGASTAKAHNITRKRRNVELAALRTCEGSTKRSLLSKCRKVSGNVPQITSLQRSLAKCVLSLAKFLLSSFCTTPELQLTAY
jgi:hypothetical protein